jgi:DNA-binding GntR family transcriptional regulator
MISDPSGLAEQTASRLRSGIIEGDLPPGLRLSETRLAAELGVSRNTLREVFRLLTREGLLRHEPNRGVFVAVPSMATIVDIYRVRRLIEVPALAHAWPRHDAVAQMRAAVERGRAARDAQDWRGVGSANMDFHAAVVALTDSARLRTFFAQITAELRLAFGLLDSPERLHGPYIDRNAEILESLVAGHPDQAAALMGRYLDESERVILEAFARLG